MRIGMTYVGGGIERLRERRDAREGFSWFSFRFLIFYLSCSFYLLISRLTLDLLTITLNQEEEGGDFLQTQYLREVRPSHQHSEFKAVIRRGIIRRQLGIHAQADPLAFLAGFYACRKTSTIY